MNIPAITPIASLLDLAKFFIIAVDELKFSLSLIIPSMILTIKKFARLDEFCLEFETFCCVLVQVIYNYSYNCKLHVNIPRNPQEKVPSASEPRG